MFRNPRLSLSHPVVRDAFAFLAAAGGEPAMRAALACVGYDRDDHREGWSRLRTASMFLTLGEPCLEDAIAELARWVESELRRGRKALLAVDPEAVAGDDPVVLFGDAVDRAEFAVEFLDAFDDAIAQIAPRPERPDRDRVRFLLFFARRAEESADPGVWETPLDALEWWHGCWMAAVPAGLKPSAERASCNRCARPRPTCADEAPIAETERSPSADVDAVESTERAPWGFDLGDEEES